MAPGAVLAPFRYPAFRAIWTANLASNLGALTLFIPSGDVLWPAALAMAVGQIAGGYLGALTGIRFGARLIKPLVVVISLILAGKMLFVH